MQVEFQPIYRVVSYDRSTTTPETYWCTDKEAIEEFVKKSPYKNTLHIEKSYMLSVPVEC